MSEHHQGVMDLADQIQRLGTNQRTGTLIVTGPAGRSNTRPEP